MSTVSGIFYTQEQASVVIDALKGKGFDQCEMIVPDLADDAGTLNINIWSEADLLIDNEGFAQVDDIHGESCIMVSVEVPIYKRGTVAEVMRQRGAVDLRIN
ncbi:MAG: hypothetical protein FD169_1265 [Bacillota bacterium]|nr:MAG: hypothetical protein FD169_1265 [Bacillota bacterium]MBS3950961.1 hypothetical protein [Peptococcaceae bacterium]